MIKSVQNITPSYLQQHHIHSPVHLGDVTQAVAPLVPFIHCAQMQKRDKLLEVYPMPAEEDSVLMKVPNSEFLTVSRRRSLPSRLFYTENLQRLKIEFKRN